MDYYQFSFEANNKETAEMLIALLANIGFDGFEEIPGLLRAFISIADFSQEAFDGVLHIHPAHYDQTTIAATNWNQKWESDFEPVTVADPVTGLPFAQIRANFHLPDPQVPYDIQVTPKMSFGTGHHATTYLVIAQMSQLDLTGKTVIDFGTGTAVLAILAEKLGASSITAIDNDDWSIENAKENILANNGQKIKLVKAETIEGIKEADIILANINLNIILQNLDNLAVACKPGTIVLFSGILEGDEVKLEEALVLRSFRVETITNQHNWLMMKAIY